MFLPISKSNIVSSFIQVVRTEMIFKVVIVPIWDVSSPQKSY